MYTKYKEDKMLLPLRHVSTGLSTTRPMAVWISTIANRFPTKMVMVRRPIYGSGCLYPAVHTHRKQKYMIFADAEFKATYNHLYDKDDKLFFRDSRYFGQQEANGKKVFWGRGNGWVIGGLAEILKTLPAEDTEYRPFYLQLFKELSESLANLQNKDGFWHASLLDPDSYPSPETSATGFIVYGLAYGVNQDTFRQTNTFRLFKKDGMHSFLRLNRTANWVGYNRLEPTREK